MNNQETVQRNLEEIRFATKKANVNLGEKLHRQHYDFAHKLMPYLIQNHFDELISGVVNKSLQAWIRELWDNCADDDVAGYGSAVYPTCGFIQPSDELSLIYFALPAPRANPEAVYSAVVFLASENSPSDWLRSYFTLELGTFMHPPMHWTFAEWDHVDLSHINRGEFETEATLENFLGKVVDEAESRWSLELLDRMATATRRRSG